MTGLELLLDGLRADPSRVVVEHRGRGITAGTYLGTARALAVLLRRAGLREGDHLGVVTDNVAAMRLVLAAWMCGATPLVLDLRQSNRHLEEWHRRMNLRFVVGPRAAADPAGPEVLSLPAAPDPLDELPWEPRVSEDLVSDYFVSSGTTGVPKALPVTHASLARTIGQRLREDPPDLAGAVLSPLSLAFPGSRMVWYRGLVAGQRIVALDLLYTLRELDEALARPDVVDCTLPPVLIRRLARLPPRGEGPRYPQFRKLRAIGGPARPEDKLLALDRLTENYQMTYSSTDTGVVSRIEGAEMRARPASSGRPGPGLKVEIVDGDRLCPPGETGSIRVHREGRNPVEPGDLGWMDEEGYLYVVGRTGGMMCRNGLNVTVAEVESALLACPAVQDVVVWATPDEDLGDRIHAVVECAAADEDAVARHVRRRMSIKERPDRLGFTRAMPRTPGGKPDRRALIADLAGEPALG